MTQPIRSTLCCLLIASQLLSGCATWQPTRLTPTTLTEAGNPAKVRIRQTDGTTFVLHSPTMVADTLSGQVDAQPRRIPLASVIKMEIRKVTFTSVVGPVVIGVLGFVAGVIMVCSVVGGCTLGE